MRGPTLTIGTWHEAEAREIQRCPSYYAADHETLRTTPGAYPLSVEFRYGYTVPMPDAPTAPIDTVRVSGALYSGFGGVNFARTELKPGEAVTYWERFHLFQLRELVDAGRVTLLPGFEWLLEPTPWKAPGALTTWEAVRAVRDAQASAAAA